MRISDWSSDVCSSDLFRDGAWDTDQQVGDKVRRNGGLQEGRRLSSRLPGQHEVGVEPVVEDAVVAVCDRRLGAEAELHVVREAKIGRAAGRERVCQYV